MKIYALTNGEYEDYEVIGVYSTHENAKWAQKFHGGEIVEWVVDQDIESPEIQNAKINIFPFEIRMKYSGEVTYNGKTYNCNGIGPDPFSSIKVANPGLHIWEKTKRKYVFVSGIEGIVWAKDENQAIEIANAVRIKFIADGTLIDFPSKENLY